MPNFLIKLLIDLAISWGIPAFLSWVSAKLPWIPKNVVDIIVNAAKAFLEQIKPVSEDETLTPVEKRAKYRQLRKDAIGAAVRG
jgi:hypothetical protein